MNVILKKYLLCIVLVFILLPLKAQQNQESDSLMLLLKKEVKANFEKLSKRSVPAYFLSYRVENISNHYLESVFGSIHDKDNESSSVLVVEIRLGTPAFDNFHAHSESHIRHYSTPFPLEYNGKLMSKILSSTTEKAFVDASREYSKLKTTYSLSSENNNTEYLFESADRNSYFEPATNFYFDDEFWEEQARFYTSDISPFLNQASAKLSYTCKRSYFVSSEDVYITENQQYTYLDLFIEGFSTDNSNHHISYRYFSNIPSQLPDKYAVNLKLKQMEELVFQVVAADKFTSAECPVLFSTKVASLLFHNIVGHISENSDNLELLKSLSNKNLLYVTSDPSLKSLNNQILSGYYIYDNEGVLGEQVNIVTKGLPVEILSGRTQNDASQKSNGHFRHSPVVSNMVVRTYNPLSHKELLEKMRQIIRESGQEYGLYVVDADIICNRSELLNIYPTVCYMVFSDNKPAKLIRNLKINCSAESFVKNILFMGDSLGSVAIKCNVLGKEVPSHSCAPELLLSSLKCSSYQADNIYRYYKSVPPSFDIEEDNIFDLFTEVAQKEHEKNLEELHTETQNAPYYSEFLFTDAKTYHIKSSEGSILISKENDLKSVSPRFLIGSDTFNNENLYEANNSDRNIYTLSDELNNQNLTRELSIICRKEYEEDLLQWNHKNTIITQNIKNQLPDRVSAQKVSERSEINWHFQNIDYLSNRISDISGKFVNHDFIQYSVVEFSACIGNAYFWNSENLVYSKPVSLIMLKLNAQVKDAIGNIISNEKEIIIDEFKNLFTQTADINNERGQNIDKEIDKFISECKDLTKSVLFEEDYYGPVLVQSEAVEQLLINTLVKGKTNIITHREPLLFSEENRKHLNYNDLEKKIDHIVTNNNITVTVNGDRKSSYNRDAEGVEIEKLEVIRNGELINLLNDCTPTKSIPHSNGGRIVAITKKGFITSKGVETLNFEFRKKISAKGIYNKFLKEASNKGFKYAYMIERMNQDGMITKLYRVDVKSREVQLVTGAKIPINDFYILRNIEVVSSEFNERMVRVYEETNKNIGETNVSMSVKSPKTLLFSILPITK